MRTDQSQVVVAYEFGKTSQSALERAVALASRAPFHVLQFVCVLDPSFGVAAFSPTTKVDLAYCDRVREALAAVVDRELRAAGTQERITFHVHVRIAANPANEILAVAREVGADLIVIGSHGHKGLERAVLGSVSEKVVREAECAVVIARQKTYPYVALLDVVEVEGHAHQRTTHTYDSGVATVGPFAWPGA